MEKAGYCILILATIAWIIAGICGMFQNICIGIIGLATIIRLDCRYVHPQKGIFQSRVHSTKQLNCGKKGIFMR